MTKADYLKDVMPHDKWLRKHKEYVANALKKMQEYFDCEGFIKSHEDRACREVIESILADSFENNNYQLGELESALARMLCIPYKEVAEYRTNKFWEEIDE